MRKFIISVSLLCLAIAPMARAGGLMSFSYGGTEGFCLDAYANTTASYDLHLINPTNPSFDNGGAQAVTHIGGFECRIVPREGVVVLGVDFPVPAIDVGSDQGMIVGYGQPVPVGAYGFAVLATVHVFFTNNVSFDLPISSNWPCYIDYNTGMGIMEAYPASISGSVAFVDADDPDIDPLAPADFNPVSDVNIRMFQDPAVPTENGPWGQIKAMYR